MQGNRRRAPRVESRIVVRPASSEGPADLEVAPAQSGALRPRRRARHAAPAPAALPRPDLQLLGPLGGFIACGLSVLVVLALGGLPVVGLSAQAWMRVLLGCVVIVSSAAVFALTWRKRRDSVEGRRFNLVVGLFATGTALITLYHVVGDGHVWLWYGGQALWLLAIPLLALRMISQQTRPTVVRPFGVTLTLVDALLMACAWSTMVWRQHLWDAGSISATGSMLWVVWLDLFVLMLILLLAVARRDLGLVLGTPAVLCIALATIVTAQMGAGHGASGWPLVLLTLAWPLLVLSAWVGWVDPNRPAQDSTAEQLAGLITLINVLVPLGIAFGAMAATLETDRTTIMLTGLVVLVFGVRELIRTQQSADLVELLAEQATHDPLTGLANRRALGDRLRELSEAGQPAAVLILDVDRFKLVNTEFGHAMGDEVLAAVGQALRTCCAPLAATAFRLGGDEFSVVMIGDDQTGLMLAERVRSAVVQHTNLIPGVENIGLTASVGVAALQRETDPLAVLGRAAEALRVAKLERNRVRLYTQDLRNEVNRRHRLETRLRRAVDLGSLDFHYQPIVDLRSGRILGLESLARWHDEELGSVSPTDFVPIAEQAGLIHELGRLAIESALRVAQTLNHHTGRDGYVAVNVSPLQLRRPQFVDEVVSLVNARHAHPAMLKFEVTEGIFMDTDDPAVDILRRLNGLGFGIAIDDFGSGYSSLGYMSRLPIETVKVDRVLTSQVGDSRTRSVVRALVWVAEAHGLQVILEGVESEQTAATLRQLGVRWGQGWLWSRAVPEAEVPAVLSVLGTVALPLHRADARLTMLRERQASFGIR